MRQGVGADRWTLTFVGHYDYKNRSHYDGAGMNLQTAKLMEHDGTCYIILERPTDRGALQAFKI